MRKILFITALFIYSITVSAQNLDSTSLQSTTKKKITLGVGPSGFYIASGYGGNLKFNYLLNKKLSFGLNSMLSNHIMKDYADQFSPGIVIDFQMGNAFAVMATSTIYIFGHNNFESKGGIYTSLGLGYSSNKDKNIVTSLAATSDSAYFKRYSDYGNKDFSCLITLGGDRKLGPGRIFIEFSVPLAIYGTSYRNTTYEKKPYWMSSSSDNEKSTEYRGFEGMSFLNLGYHLYF